jgi:phage-related protein
LTKCAINDTIQAMSYQLYVDRNAKKELAKFSKIVRLKFQALFETLEEFGKLEEPFAKKLSGSKGLFEVRVKQGGQWRAIYAYIDKEIIVILSAFAKKTQKTPLNELKKAKSRLQVYTDTERKK